MSETLPHPVFADERTDRCSAPYSFGGTCNKPAGHRGRHFAWLSDDDSVSWENASPPPIACQSCGMPGDEERAHFVAPSTPVVFVGDHAYGSGFGETVTFDVCRRPECREAAIRQYGAGLGRGKLFAGWGREDCEPRPIPSSTLADDRAILRRDGATFARWFHR